MNALARARANEIIKKYGLKIPWQFKFEEILNAERLLLEEKALDGAMGLLVFNKNGGIITVNENIKEITQKRFTIAHELGHFVNEKDKVNTTTINEMGKGQLQDAEIIYKCGFDELYGMKRESKLEYDANEFAGELLIPSKELKSFIKGKKLDLKLLKETAVYFNVSLCVSAIKTAETDFIPCAAVMTTDGSVKWVKISKSFPYQFIRTGEKVSELSYVHDYFNGKEFPIEGEDVPASAWFREDFKLRKDDRLFEMNIAMPSYNSMLTILKEE